MNNLTHEMLVDPLKHQCVRKVNKKKLKNGISMLYVTLTVNQIYVKC